MAGGGGGGWGGVGAGAATGAGAGVWGGPVGIALGAGIGAIGSLFGAKSQSHAATRSAQIQSQAATEAARIQAQSEREQLDFTKQQDVLQRQAEEATRRANYEQWAAQRRRLGTLGDLIGQPPPEIPAYIPGYAGGADAGTLGSYLPQTRTAPTTGGAQTVPGGDYQALFQSLIAGKPFNQQTLLDLEPTLNQYGIRLTPPNAVGDRTKIQLPTGEWVRVGFGEGHPVWVVQPGARMALGAAQTTGAGTLASYLPTSRPLLTPPLEMPTGSLGSYMRG